MKLLTGRAAAGRVQRRVQAGVRVLAEVCGLLGPGFGLQAALAQGGGPGLHHAGDVGSAGRGCGLLGSSSVALSHPVHREELHHDAAAVRECESVCSPEPRAALYRGPGPGLIYICMAPLIDPHD